MRCSFLSSCCSLWTIALLAIVIAMAVFYFRCRRCCSNLPAQKSMQPTKISLFGLKYPFSLPTLPYDYAALEPHVDALTMQIHHTKHHQAYVDNLNKALSEAPEFQRYTIDELMANIDALPSSIRDRVRNHGGGHFNHTLFWVLMSPQGGGNPTDSVSTEIIKRFGSFQAFKEQFEQAAQARFGSGWAWLCVTPARQLIIISTANQDGPLTQGLYPILALDVWEHAYYLKFQNKRPDYINAWWNVVDWNHVEKLYHQAIQVMR